MKVVVISGSPRKNANTQVLMKYVFEYTKSKYQETKFINLSGGQIECYRGPNIEYNETTKEFVKFLPVNQCSLHLYSQNVIPAFVFLNFESRGFFCYHLRGSITNEMILLLNKSFPQMPNSSIQCK